MLQIRIFLIFNYLFNGKMPEKWNSLAGCERVLGKQICTQRKEKQKQAEVKFMFHNRIFLILNL